jgi:hypothetical protein
MNPTQNPMTSGSTQWLGPGFTANNASAYAFKKALLRANTSIQTKYYQEPIATPVLWREYVASDPIPPTMPTDFSPLSEAQIASTFGIQPSEIDDFYSYSNGANVFSIQKSESYPYIYKISNCLLQPFVSNPMSSFSAYTPRTKVNLLANTIPFVFSQGAFNGKFTRTVSKTRELSLQGRDIVLPQQLAYVFDFDTGVFTCYMDDNSPGLKNPITINSPPCITCYVYKGSFGNFLADVFHTSANAVTVSDRQVIIGKHLANNKELILDVSGNSLFTDIEALSISTTSDRRLKENIVSYKSRLGLLDVEPKMYNYISKPGVTELGLIAQEIEPIVPELVKTHNGMKSLQYDRLGVLLLPIVKDQRKRIEDLETEMQELKRGVTYLLGRKMSEA